MTFAWLLRLLRLKPPKGGALVRSYERAAAHRLYPHSQRTVKATRSHP